MKISTTEPSPVASSPSSPLLSCSSSSYLNSFDVTFPSVRCSLVSLDAMDISGEQHIDIRHDITKKRINPHGDVIETTKDGIGAPKIEKPLQKHGGRLEHKESYCGSCFGAEATGGRSWNVPTGRRDGRISLASDTAHLPLFTESVDALKRKFRAFNLTTKDLVTLSGAHTIGTAACQFFRYRVYNFTATGADPTVDPGFVAELRSLCPENGDPSRRVALDTGSQDVFDASYFANLRRRRGYLNRTRSCGPTLAPTCSCSATC